MPITDDKIQELRAQHRNKVLHLKNGDSEAVFRMPSRDEYFAFRTDEDAPKYERYERILLGCCVYPERPQFMAMLEEYPGLIDSFINELLVWSGVKKAEVVKK